MKRNALSVVAFVLAAAGIVDLLATDHLFATTALPIGVQVGVVLLMLWARATFGWRSFHASASTSAGGLVTSGPYRWWRHPIYASIVYFVWAGQARGPTAASLAVAAVVTAALVARMLIEEHFLRIAYPGYGEYARRAKRLIPFIA